MIEVVADTGDFETMIEFKPIHAMATEKLAEGILVFSEDIEKLEAYIISKM